MTSEEVAEALDAGDWEEASRLLQFTTSKDLQGFRVSVVETRRRRTGSFLAIHGGGTDRACFVLIGECLGGLDI